MPLPRPATGDRFVAPRTPVEIIMAGTWCEHLGQSTIGVHDDFFCHGWLFAACDQYVDAAAQTTRHFPVPQCVFSTTRILQGRRLSRRHNDCTACPCLSAGRC